MELIEQYANQKVIEELEIIAKEYIDLSNKRLSKYKNQTKLF